VGLLPLQHSEGKSRGREAAPGVHPAKARPPRQVMSGHPSQHSLKQARGRGHVVAHGAPTSAVLAAQDTPQKLVLLIYHTR
jgi:hypothetical protein